MIQYNALKYEEKYEPKIKVTITPIKEIKITHLFKTSVENLTKLEAISESPRLYWCNGILFNFINYESDEVTAKQLDGILHINAFHYAICDQRPDISKWNGYSLEVSDLTGHYTFENLTKSIKEELK